MKKLLALTALFALSMGIGAGLVAVTPTNSSAAFCQGPYSIELTCETGPLCTDPAYPYYAYKWGTFIGHPCPLFGYCHDDVRAGC